MKYSLRRWIMTLLNQFSNCHIFKFSNCILICLLALTACNDRKSIPFPEGETEFAQPVIKTLQLSQPKKFDWIVTHGDSTKAPVMKKIDFNNIPSKSFYPYAFVPMSKPVAESPFDLNKLPDTAFNINTIPSKPLHLVISLVQAPVIVKSGLSKLKKNASAGFFEFGADQGLPGNNAYTFLQDRDGMLWIASDNGLCCFNGEYLEIYSFIDLFFTGNVSSVSKMIEDNRGRIWVKTDFNGVYIFDRKAGTVSHFDIEVKGFDLNPDNGMIIDNKGIVWIASINNGVFIVDAEKQTIRHLSSLRTADDTNARQIIEDADGKIWIGTLKGISVIDEANSKIHFVNHAAGLPSDVITGLYKDDENRIWAGTGIEGAEVINTTAKTIKHITAYQGVTTVITHFIEDAEKKIWMASGKGLYVCDTAFKNIKHVDESNGLSNNFIIALLKDNGGQLWIATGGGINLLGTKGMEPEYVRQSDGLSGTTIWEIIRDSRQRVWLASSTAVDVYDPQKHSIQSVAAALGLRKVPNIAYGICAAPHGNFVINAPGDGMAILDSANNNFRYINSQSGLQHNFIVSMLCDEKGRIWTGSLQNDGVEIINPADNSFTVINKKGGLIGTIVWALMEDETGRVWAATDSGINIINPADGTIRYLMDGNHINKVNGGAFVKDDAGNTWIGTRTGLLIADEKNNLLTSITTRDGLSAKDVYTLFKYNGCVYAGTGSGLTVFTPMGTVAPGDKTHFNRNIKQYKSGQGFLYTNFNSGASAAIDNKLWWGIEDKALTITNPVAVDSSSSVTHISGISISDKMQNFITNKWIQDQVKATDSAWSSNKDTFYLKDKLPPDTGWLQKNNIVWDSLTGYFNLPVNLTLPHNRNFLSFHFTGAQMSNRDKVRYRYILEGFDKSWSAITANPFSENYVNIPPGSYTFKVSSKAFDGVWGAPAEFSFTITLPWWRMWWAWLLYIAVFALVVWIIVQYRSRLLKKENRRLEEMVTLRTDELTKSINDLKNTQTQLVQSEKMASLGELTAGIAHEIQNPLNFVNNFSEVNKELIDELKTEKTKDKRDEKAEDELLNDIYQNLDKIAYHGKRADAIVKGMLQHSRKSTGQKEPADINAIADEYLRLSYHGLRAKDKSFNATLHTRFDESAGLINIVPQDIGRVLLNLFNNAFYVVTEKKKKLPDGYEPAVTVTTKRIKNAQSGDRVEIRVKDNGNGIPQSVADKIFQPFFTTKPPGEGTGLGLSLSYDIVTNGHGGEIRMESKEGEGAEFVITLPVK